MQIRHLFLTSLIISGSALASTSLQHQEAPSQEMIELVGQAQAGLAGVEVDLLLEQLEAAQDGMEAKQREATAPKGQGPDRGYLGIQMTLEDGVMLVGSVMPDSGADKAGL
jgi:hypothetical protein